MKHTIGMFDSGVGGLSVWREVASLLPNDDIIYFADNANCPYGPKSAKEVISYSEKIVDFLITEGAEVVVVACNTATAAAIDYLRAKYDIPFVGMEPAVKPAAVNTKTGCVGILATAGTLGSKLFLNTKEKYASDVKVVMQVGSGLVEKVENGEQFSKESEALLKKYVNPMIEQNVDHIVLGCTHYPFFRPLIDEIAGNKITIIDPAPAVARRVNEILESEGTVCKEQIQPSYRFFSSGKVDAMVNLLKNIIHLNLQSVEIKGEVFL